MNIPTGVGIMLQIVVALLIFVASYLALILCSIACLAVVELFSQRADVVRQYGAETAPLGAGVWSTMKDEDHKSRLLFRDGSPKRI
jgi:hypothetical protein